MENEKTFTKKAKTFQLEIWTFLNKNKKKTRVMFVISSVYHKTIKPIWEAIRWEEKNCFKKRKLKANKIQVKNTQTTVLTQPTDKKEHQQRTTMRTNQHSEKDAKFPAT